MDGFEQVEFEAAIAASTQAEELRHQNYDREKELALLEEQVRKAELEVRMTDSVLPPPYDDEVGTSSNTDLKDGEGDF